MILIFQVICMFYLLNQKTDLTNGCDHTNGDHTIDGRQYVKFVKNTQNDGTSNFF